MMISGGGAILVLASLAAPQTATDSAGVLLEAATRVILYPTHARIVSLYRIDRNGTGLRFDAMRKPDQLVMINQTSGPDLDPNVEQRLERRRLSVRPGVRGGSEYRIVYTVSGELDRLPLFVPNAGVDPTSSRLSIQIVGVPDDAELPAGDPSFQVAGDGVVEAAPRQLPQFVTVPRSDAENSRIGRVGWLVALGLVALVAAVVLRARGRTAKRPATD